jgi:hypothetical protein
VHVIVYCGGEISQDRIPGLTLDGKVWHFAAQHLHGLDCRIERVHVDLWGACDGTHPIQEQPHEAFELGAVVWRECNCVAGYEAQQNDVLPLSALPFEKLGKPRPLRERQ